MNRLIASALILQLLAPLPGLAAPVGAPPAAVAPTANAFGELLRDIRVRLDSERGDREAVLRDFAQSLIDRGIGVPEVEAYVKSQLTAKEYRAYQDNLARSLKGLDPAKLSTNEFSRIVSDALTQTQSRGLTYSSCAVRTTGIVLAVASVVVGLVALLKKKVDKLTEQGLYDAYVRKRAEIDAQYADRTAFLNDPQGYYDRRINSTFAAIDDATRSIGTNLDRIKSNQDEIARIQYDLYYYTDLTDSEIASMNDRVAALQYDNSRYSDSIDTLRRNIRTYQSDIATLRDEQDRYRDPKVVAQERKQLETWYPQALTNAEKDYKVSLTNMPSTNVAIAQRNEQVMKTKKTLGIIAGAGGAVSLGLVLTNTGECY